MYVLGDELGRVLDLNRYHRLQEVDKLDCLILRGEEKVYTVLGFLDIECVFL